MDRPATTFDATTDFWALVTGSTLSPARGDRGEFATLVPPQGDAFLRVQRIDSGWGGSHVDLHVDDVRTAADEAVGRGATELTDLGGVVVLRSPGGLTFCCVAAHGESERPHPVRLDGVRSIVDQLSIDVAPDRFDSEYAFWAGCTGWPALEARSDEFRGLGRPDGMPLRWLFQRRAMSDTGLDARCHLDLACDDIAHTERSHVELGATVVARRFWTVMADPAGIEYCLTPRDPDTGLLTTPSA